VPGGNASRFSQLLATAYNIEYGAEPEQQSALNLLYLLYLLGFGSTPNKFALEDKAYKAPTIRPSAGARHRRASRDQFASR